MHVYVTGFMGAGKSTVGVALANLMGRPFVDLDATIEAEEQMTISEIFEHHGESRFRQLESMALRSLNDLYASVVATGGGILSSAENRNWMKAHGTTVWLDVPFELILDRLSAEDLETRPMFESREKARALYDRRLGEYGVSDLRIEVLSAHSVADIAAQICAELDERKCAT